MTDFKIEIWDEAQFKNTRNEWSNLLERSSSDKLFMSWEWLFTWWETFSNKESMTLQIVAASNSDNVLVGLAPLFLSSATSKRILRTQRLQFLGNFWRGKGSMRTELLDFIVDNKYSNDVIRTLFSYINSSANWDEFLLSDLDINSDTYAVLMKDKPLKRVYYRQVEDYKSYYLSTTGYFDEYCRALGKNTRLKLFNRRKVLQQLGDVDYVELENDNIESHFELLNALHVKRWGEPVFEGKQLEFNLKVAKLMAEKGGLLFSVIKLDKSPISIQYNYVIDKHEYNIQSGFNENFHPKISLGYLHFGYAIESTFKKGLQVYDFLMGEGKNTQYKERLTDDSHTIVSMHVIRSRFAIIIYYLYALYKKLIKVEA